MTNLLTGIKNFWNDEEGLGTLEIILIAAVLVGVALIFKDTLTGWVNSLLAKITGKVESFDV